MNLGTQSSNSILRVFFRVSSQSIQNNRGRNGATLPYGRIMSGQFTSEWECTACNVLFARKGQHSLLSTWSAG
jgi:hypothetical protein